MSAARWVRLAAGRGAQVEHALAGLRVERAARRACEERDCGMKWPAVPERVAVGVERAVEHDARRALGRRPSPPSAAASASGDVFRRLARSASLGRLVQARA